MVGVNIRRSNTQFSNLEPFFGEVLLSALPATPSCSRDFASVLLNHGGDSSYQKGCKSYGGLSMFEKNTIFASADESCFAPIVIFPTDRRSFEPMVPLPIGRLAKVASPARLGCAVRGRAGHAGCNVTSVLLNSITSHTLNIFNYSTFNISILQ